MYTKISLMFFSACLLFAACSAPATQPAAATPIPIVEADDVLIAEGRVEPIHFAEIAFNASGAVGEVLVQEGQAVKQGDVLARLANSESYQAEVAHAEEALILAQRAFDASQSTALKDLGEAYEAVRTAQLNLDNFDIPSYLEGGTPAESVARLYAEFEAARQAYEPYRYQGENDQTRKEYRKRLDNARDHLARAIRWAKLEADLAQAQSELESAQAEFTSTVNGSQDKSLAQASYEAAQANLLAAQAALSNVELVAPFDGVVAEVTAKQGASINAGEIAIRVADFSSWIVKTTDVTELDVVKLTEGQPVVVSLDAIPDIELTGQILYIGQTYSENQGDIVYEVLVLLGDAHPAMRWGMTAAVRFVSED